MNYPGTSTTGVSATGSNTHSNAASHLPHGTRLHGGTFAVGKVLGQGGCGITYHGSDTNLRRDVAIKEFFPPGCARSGSSVVSSASPAEYAAAKEQFLEEARSLARFSHRGIVNVLLVFEENNTAYMVMELLKGKSLQQLVEDTGPLPEQQAIGHIAQMAGALTVVHQAGFIHRDLKPANAIVCDDGRVVLIDFGLNKKMEVAQTYHTRVLSHAAPTGTEGYAPPEQYLKDSIQGIATDVYALGATLYFLVTGQVPVSAPERAMGAPFRAPANVNPAISQSTSDAIMRALELKEAARPQSAQEFLKFLTSGAQVVPAQVTGAQVAGSRPSRTTQIPTPPPTTRSKAPVAPAPISSPPTTPAPPVTPLPPLTPVPPNRQPVSTQLVRCRKCTAMNPVTATECSVCHISLTAPDPLAVWDRSPLLYHLSMIGITIVVTIIFLLWAILTA